MLENAEEAPPQSTTSPEARLDAEYAAVEAVLLDSARGRWFLSEYARRNRAADTEMLLDAIAKLELAVLRPQRRYQDQMLSELIEMSEAIARARREIAAIKPPNQLLAATEELDNIVEATEKATSDILAGAEEIQEVAWTLRERGTDIELCDKIDQRATDIYTACSFQDITGQRTGKVVRALRFIEQRINAMIEIWGVDDIAHRVDDIASRMQTYAETALREGSNLLNGPQGKDKGLKQDDVDRMLTLREQPPASGAVQEAPPRRREEQHVSGSRVAKDGGRLERPDPLTFAELEAVKRASLFG
jgi:chemotaxis protein CheZ